MDEILAHLDFWYMEKNLMVKMFFPDELVRWQKRVKTSSLSIYLPI